MRKLAAILGKLAGQQANRSPEYQVPITTQALNTAFPANKIPPAIEVPSVKKVNQSRGPFRYGVPVR